MPFPFIRFEPLYAARGDANGCLDLLRLETSKAPIRTSYSFTSGSCTAILRLRLSDLPIADHVAVVEREIGYLARSVAAQDFMGTSRYSSSGGNSADDLVENTYASLHCTKSWGGIARWIAEWQLGDSIGNRTLDTAPTEAPPVQKLKIEF
ncbi:hypothetical protein BGZ67_001570 [Mortierella alpina]|nr:hypothetical protein BGZ67_001570 [Mortierella alpina]